MSFDKDREGGEREPTHESKVEKVGRRAKRNDVLPSKQLIRHSEDNVLISIFYTSNHSPTSHILLGVRANFFTSTGDEECQKDVTQRGVRV